MKVDVARRVDQIQLVRLAVVVEVNRDRSSFNRDAPFPLDVQVVKDLFFELALRDRSGLQQKLVSERALAMVNMGNDGKVAN
jgi:hypothetical protein